MTKTCQLSRRQLSVALPVILIEAQILQSHFQAGNLTLGQLVIWYFIKFGSLCLMTNWKGSSLLQGTLGSGGVHTCTYAHWKLQSFSSKAKWQVLHRLGARNSAENRKWLDAFSFGCSFRFCTSMKLPRIFFRRYFFMIYSSSRNCFFMIDEQWNSPLEVERSRCSVKTLVCHYIHLWCEVYSTASSLWEQLFSSSSLKGHYGMGKPSWPKAKYIICLLAPREHTSQSRLTPVRMLRIWTIFQSHIGICHPLKSAVFIVLNIFLFIISDFRFVFHKAMKWSNVNVWKVKLCLTQCW